MIEALESNVQYRRVRPVRGVSVRMLRHYDRIGLKPKRVDPRTGYRS